jgi:hypothetical protein
MKSRKQVDIPMELYTVLLEYAHENQLKNKSATQGEFVLAAIQKLADTLSTAYEGGEK